MKNIDGIIRVGGIGAGRIFQWAHLNSYPRLFEKARLVGFFDLNPERAQQARDKYVSTLAEYAADNPQYAEAVKTNLNELRCHSSLEELLNQVNVMATTKKQRKPS